MQSSEDDNPITLRVTRTVTLPDPVKIARYEKNPDLGPRLLFFSGGTALRDLSRRLICYTANSIHLITPFDSGGSSAELRKAFKMPAVGDIRNRLMALADQSFLGNPEIYTLFAYRLPKDMPVEILLGELAEMAAGRHPLVAKIPDPMRKIIRNHLYVFLEKMPETFDPRGASIGNLILAAGYLSNRRLLDPVIYIFSKLVECRGVVRPVVNKNRHLAAQMADGTLLIGQHLITGKETGSITARIQSVFLTDDARRPHPVEVPIREKTRSLIARADLICYPMGSFYSSIIANLLPKGVGDAIRRVDCPKVYVPNTAPDPEAFGMNLSDQVETLLYYLKKDDPEGIQTDQVLNYVAVDKKNADALREVGEIQKIEASGVRIIFYPIVTNQSSPMIDESPLIDLLLSLT